jgi:hypothetical protein
MVMNMKDLLCFLKSVLSNRSSTSNKTCTTLLSSLLEGIDHVVKTIPYDKASGPDDFSGMLIKQCRHIIRDDIYELCMIFLMVLWIFKLLITLSSP